MPLSATERACSIGENGTKSVTTLLAISSSATTNMRIAITTTNCAAHVNPAEIMISAIANPTHAVSGTRNNRLIWGAAGGMAAQVVEQSE
jgi:hypothetical protein